MLNSRVDNSPNFLCPTMPLVIPGTTSFILLAQAPTVQAGGADKDKLDPHFLAMLTQGKISEELMNKIGKAEVENAAIFGRLAADEKSFVKWCEGNLNLDPVADAIKIAKLVLIWEAARKRTDVETDLAAQRAAQRLPPQLRIEDQSDAKDALEK